VISITKTIIFSFAMDMSIRDRIRKRREDDDDDLMLLILPALHHLGYLGGTERQPQHTSLLTGAEKVRELLEGPVKKCRIAFRMEPYIFKALANYLRRPCRKVSSTSREVLSCRWWLCEHTFLPCTLP
jgi:hypothetical protein